MKVIVRSAWAAACAWSCILLSATASAEPTEAQRRAAADASFVDAQRLMAEADFAAACPKLEDAVRLEPQAAHAKLALADCYLGLRQRGAVLWLPAVAEPPAESLESPDAGAKARAPSGDEPPLPTAWPALRVGGVVTGGVGVGLLIAGTALAASGIANTNAAADAYAGAQGRGDAPGMEAASTDHDAGKSQAIAGWATVGVGGAALVAGVVMAALPARDEPEGASRAALLVAPWVTGAAGGVTLGGAW